MAKPRSGDEVQVLLKPDILRSGRRKTRLIPRNTVLRGVSYHIGVAASTKRADVYCIACGR